MAAPGQDQLQILLDGKELDFTTPVPPRPDLTSEQLFPYVVEAQDVTREATEGFTKAIDALHRRACEVTNEYHMCVQEELRRLRNDKDHLRGNLQLSITEGEKLTEEKDDLKKDLEESEKALTTAHDRADAAEEKLEAHESMHEDSVKNTRMKGEKMYKKLRGVPRGELGAAHGG